MLFFIHSIHSSALPFFCYVLAGLDHRSAGDSVSGGHEDGGVRGPELTSWEDHINRWVWNWTMSQNLGTCCSKQRHERQGLISGLYAVQTLPCTDIFGPRKPDYKQALWCCHGDSLFPLSDGTYWPIVHLVYGIESLLLPPERRNLPSAFAAGFPALRSLWALSPSRSLSISCPASYPLTDWLISWWEQRERERERHDGCYWHFFCHLRAAIQCVD